MATGFRIPPPPQIPSFARSGPTRSAPGIRPTRASSPIEFSTSGLKGIPKIPAMHHVSTAIAHASGSVSAPSVALSSVSQSAMGIHPAGSNAITSAPSLGNFMGSPSTGGGLSAQQAAFRQWQIDHPQHSNSFVGNLEAGAGDLLSGGGQALAAIGNVLSRPMYALGTGYERATQHGGFNFGQALSGAEAGISGRSHDTLGQVFARRGDFGSNPWVKGALSLGTDVIADPLNLLGGVGVDERLAAELLKSADGARIVGRVLGQSLGEGGTTMKDLEELTARNASAGAEFAKLRDTMTPLGKTFHDLNQEEWAQLASDHPNFLGDTLGATSAAGGQAAIRGARAEAKLSAILAHRAASLTPHVLRVGLMNPLTGRAVRIAGHDLATPIFVKGLRVAPYTPSLLNTAAGLSGLSHVPGAKRAAEFLGTHLKPSWKNPLLHALEKGRDYNAQSLRRGLLHDMRASVAPVAKGLSEEEQRRALDVAEQVQGGVHMGEAVHERGGLNHQAFNEAAIADPALQLSEHQMRFVSAWHDWMNRLLEEERAMGLQHEGLADIAGRVYVPHKIVQEQAPGYVEGASWQKMFAQYARKNPEDTLQALARAGKDSQGRSYVTDPGEILGIRTAASARAQSHAALVHVMANVFGKSPMKADTAARLATEAKLGEAEAQKAEHLAAHGVTEEQVLHAKQHGGLLAPHQAALDEATSTVGQGARDLHASVHAAADEKMAEAADLRHLAEEQAATALPSKERRAELLAEHPDYYSALQEATKANGAYRRALHGARLRSQRIAEKGQAVSDLAAQHADERAAEVESRTVARTHNAHVKSEARLSKQIEREQRLADKGRAEHAATRQAADEMIQHGHDQVQGQVEAVRQMIAEHIDERLAELPHHHVEPGHALTRETAAEKIVGELQGEMGKVSDVLQRARAAGDHQVADAAQRRIMELDDQAGAVRGWGARFRGKKLPEEFANHPAVKLIGKETQHVPDAERVALEALSQHLGHTKTVEDIYQLIGDHEHVPAGLRDAVAHMHDLQGSGIAEHVDELGTHVSDNAERLAALKQERSIVRGKVTRSKKANAEHLARNTAAEAREKVRVREMSRATAAYQRAISGAAEHQAKVGVAEAARSAAHARLGLVEKPPRLTPAPQFTRRADTLEREAARMRKTAGAKLHAFNKTKGPQLGRLSDKLKRGTQRIIQGYDKRQALVLKHQEKLDSAEFLTKQELPGHVLHENPILGKGVLLPEKIHTALVRIEEVEKDPAVWSQTTGKVMRAWKELVTVGNFGGYRLRNTMSDLWNAYLKGMPMRSMPAYAVRALRLLRAARKGDVAALHTMHDLEMEGVTQGLYHSDVRTELGRFQREAKLEAGQRGPLRYYMDQAGRANVEAENAGRIMHYLWQRDRLRRLGDPHADEQAALEVVEAHFDYADLTGFDENMRRYLVPFWTWTRKNVPYQLAQMGRRPGRAAAFFLGAQDSEAAGGSHKGEIVPSFFADAGAIRLPDGRYFLPQIGIMDLARITTKQGLESMGPPGVQLFSGLTSGVNPFTGAQINSDTHALQPENPIIASLLSRLGVPGGQTKRNIGGTWVKSPGVQGYAKWLLGQLPETNYLQGYNPVQTRERSGQLRALQEFLGLGVYPVDQRSEQQLAQIDAANRWQKALRSERDAGQYPESKRRKVSPNQAQLNQVIAQAYGRR